MDFPTVEKTAELQKGGEIEIWNVPNGVSDLTFRSLIEKVPKEKLIELNWKATGEVSSHIVTEIFEQISFCQSLQRLYVYIPEEFDLAGVQLVLNSCHELQRMTLGIHRSCSMVTFENNLGKRKCRVSFEKPVSGLFFNLLYPLLKDCQEISISVSVLAFFELNLTDEVLSRIGQNNPNLEKLTLDSCRYTAAGLINLMRNCPKLSELMLYWIEHFTSADYINIFCSGVSVSVSTMCFIASMCFCADDLIAILAANPQITHVRLYKNYAMRYRQVQEWLTMMNRVVELKD